MILTSLIYRFLWKTIVKVVFIEYGSTIDGVTATWLLDTYEYCYKFSWCWAVCLATCKIPHCQVNGCENYWHYSDDYKEHTLSGWPFLPILNFLHMPAEHCMTLLSLNKCWCFLVDLQISCSSSVSLTLLAFADNVYVSSFLFTFFEV